jgi:hypothetical protein
VAWQTKVHVVASRTAGSDELIDALRRRAERGPMACTLLVPAGAGAGERLETALSRFREAGLEAEGQVGVDANPLFALAEVWDGAVYDEIVVSTFPTGVSHWMNLDLPQRVARLTNAPVEHVVAARERAAAHA